MRNRSIQIKLLRDGETQAPPGSKPIDQSAVATEIIREAAVAVTVGYTICKTVNLVCGVVQHIVVTKI